MRSLGAGHKRPGHMVDGELDGDQINDARLLSASSLTRRGFLGSAIVIALVLFIKYSI